MLASAREAAMMRKALVCAAFAAMISTAQSDAAITVLGNGLANVCSQAAQAGSDDLAALETCTLALETEFMKRRDRAGTFVNRGVIKMRRKDYGAARKDFDTAVRLQPDMGEAFVNRGAALVGQKRYAEALADINKGLELGPEELEKAYYNRAMAHEGLDDIKGAYFDYLRALEIKPDWDIAQQQLTRFTVVRPSG
jgi:tetratricopeptide (TPR) repeat protein